MQNRGRWAGWCALLVSALCVLIPAALGQESGGKTPTAETATATPEPQALPLSDVPDAAVQADSALRSMTEDLAPNAIVEKFDRTLAAAQDPLRRDEEQTRRVLTGVPSGGSLEELEAVWSARRRQIDEWAKLLQTRSRDLGDRLDELERMDAVWAKTADAAAQEMAPQVILDRIADTRDRVRTVTRDTRQRRREVLTRQETVGAVRADIDKVLDDVRRARTVFVSHLFDPQGPPIWKWFSRHSGVDNVFSEAGVSLSRQFESIRDYLNAHWNDILLLVVASIFVAFFLRRGRVRAAKWAEEDPALAAFTKVLSAPYSMAAVLLLFALSWSHRMAPTALQQLFGLVALVPAVHLLRQLVPPRLFGGVYGLSLFYVVDRLRSLLSGTPRGEWLVFALEMMAALLLTVHVLSPERIGDFGWQADDRRRRLVLGARNLVLAIFVIAFVATGLGYVRLGSLLGDGVLGSSYVAILVYASAETFKGLWTYLLRSRVASSLRFVRNNRWLLQRRGHRVISIVAAITWVAATLRSFALLSPAWEVLSALFGARFEQGNFSVSLGDVALFSLAVWASLQVSRFVRFILDEDVFARIELAHGASYAVSTLLHYCLIIGGFFVGVSVIGFDMSRFAIVAGALSVGIGFGLQNVVNNFVSGLILLFERPIQVGDAVQVGALSGEVRHIGIRASTIRTWDGAELIVPNGTLISETVTNWTLTDRMKRIDIPVGVAYGNDPTLVLKILGDVARANPGIAAAPPVAVLFKGLGDNSLDFEVRAWTVRFENWLTLRTELLTAIVVALGEAGIEIPFPQRDVHIRSVAETVAQRLTGGIEPSDDGGEE